MLSTKLSTSRTASTPTGLTLTCRKEQVVPIVTSRVTLPRRSCTFPDLRMSSLPTCPSVRSARVQVFSASLASCEDNQGMETGRGIVSSILQEQTLSQREASAAKVRMSSPDFPGDPVAKTLNSQCREPGSIPGQGTRPHIPQLRVHMPQLTPQPRD